MDLSKWELDKAKMKKGYLSFRLLTESENPLFFIKTYSGLYDLKF